MSDFNFWFIYLTITFIVALFLFIALYNKNDKTIEDRKFELICFGSIFWPLTIMVIIIAIPILAAILIYSILTEKKEKEEQIQDNKSQIYLDNSEFDWGHNVKNYNYDGEEY